MDRSWQIEEAQARLTEIVGRALAGEPQVIARQDGAEVVILPRAPVKTSPSKKSGVNVLMAGGPLENDDTSLDEAIAELRATGMSIMGLLQR